MDQVKGIKVKGVAQVKNIKAKTLIFIQVNTHIHSYTIIYTHIHPYTIIYTTYTHIHSYTLIHTHI